MIQQLQIKHPDGVTPLQVPWVEYEISKTESIGVIGIDYNKYSSSPIPDHPEVKMATPGKLSEEPLERDLIQKIQESLRRDEWDFEKYPNPELVVMTLKDCDEVLESRFPFDKECSFFTGELSIVNSWREPVTGFPSAKTVWPDVPTWEDMIEALIKWSKANQVPFDAILNDGIFCQENSGVFYGVPEAIKTWAYERFKATFVVTGGDLKQYNNAIEAAFKTGEPNDPASRPE